MTTLDFPIRALTFSLVLLHVEMDSGSLSVIPAGHVLIERAIGPQSLRHVDLGEISSLVHPAAIATESIQLVVSDQVRSQVFLPEADAFQFVVGVTLR